MLFQATCWSNDPNHAKWVRPHGSEHALVVQRIHTNLLFNKFDNVWFYFLHNNVYWSTLFPISNSRDWKFKVQSSKCEFKVWTFAILIMQFEYWWLWLVENLSWSTEIHITCFVHRNRVGRQLIEYSWPEQLQVCSGCIADQANHKCRTAGRPTLKLNADILRLSTRDCNW